MAREKLPTDRVSVTHKVVVHAETGRVKFFFTVGFYADGRPGELFMHMDSPGSTLDGMADAWSTTVSLYLQNGGDLKALARKLEYHKFEPAGMTDNPEIRNAHSVVDYVVRWMMKHCEEKK